ncbi:cardiolipin synthase [Butyrivibrio sp. INlla16]|uniref:cardiolipin synthase n=1 Tax=Butyrivibrio sp. INlla16 TaxID=1520807 RepID=UPI00088DA95C|nr:cardiolipin synthase [Butyrivibrio sp. INlla16]SDB61933.1 cardiolipin synthase [Butyrivibrio sp. INlla16]
MKKIIGRIIIVIPALALQVVWFYLTLGLLNRVTKGHLGEIINGIFTVLAVFFVARLIARRDESSYKLLWVLVIVALPVLGAMLYFTLGNKTTGRALRRKLQKTASELKGLYNGEQLRNTGNLDEIEKEDVRLSQTLSFITESTGFPVLKNDSSKYYPFGEMMFADMCEDLKRAESFIFIEYFIIQSGKFWGTITEILAERVQVGVDVRVMYDDLGSIATYSVKDITELSKLGIKCVPFNPFFLIKSQLNNRDHRKIMVIDGKVAYSGGVNLADEYINEKQMFGRWKDIGFRVTGKAVACYTYMFAEFWNAFAHDKISDEELKKVAALEEASCQDNGYILPYYDSPMRDEHTSNILFTELLSTAKDYVWFYTPYLMLGDALFDAFIRAARRGLDVRIIMPGIPDKKLVYRLSRSYYEDLLKAGVKIYEYTPGFVHAKAFVSDDKLAGIGTVNLDYRSLFLHFECSSIFYKADIVKELKADYLNTLKECKERSLEDINRKLIHKLINNFLRVLAPLL